LKRVLAVDGYNIIHAWKDLNDWKDAAGFDAAREMLITRLQDYAGYAGIYVILVFDAHMGFHKKASVERKAGIDIVFTGSGETADHYIERVADELQGKDCEYFVATSDSLEQSIVLGRGGVRLSPRELAEDMERERRVHGVDKRKLIKSNRLEDRLGEEILKRLEQMRCGGGE
jgi:uncharacterized protein